MNAVAVVSIGILVGVYLVLLGFSLQVRRWAGQDARYSLLFLLVTGLLSQGYQSLSLFQRFLVFCYIGVPILTDLLIRRGDSLLLWFWAIWLWIPVEFRIGFRTGLEHSSTIALGTMCILWLMAVRREEWTGMLRLPRIEEIKWAILGLLGFALFAIPFGFLTEFLRWEPRYLSPLQALWIYLLTAFPEVVLYRGILFGQLRRWMDWRLALLLSSLLFGISHFNDRPYWGGSYFLLSIVAGGLYGWIFHITNNLHSSALFHWGVDFLWMRLFGRT